MEIRRTPEERGTRLRLFAGDKEVSGLALYDLVMRVGNVPVRMGGIGGVSTKREHRDKGYARKVMEDSTAFMAEAGFDVALLFGIPDFYPKFGYAVCMPECSFTVATRDAERAQAAFGMSAASEEDAEAVRRLYEEVNRSRTGSVVRNEARREGWRGSRWEAKAECFVAKDAAGELAAYAVLDQNAGHTISCEAAARSAEGYESVVRFLAEDAIRKRAGEIRVICPYDHPFVDAASRFGAKVEIGRRRCGGPMGRLIDPRSLMQKLLPLFSKRLRCSPLRGTRFAVKISTELGSTTIAFDGEEAGLEETAASEPCELAAPALMQLVMGYRSARAVGAGLAGEDGIRALETLFPRGEAHTWHPDRF